MQERKEWVATTVLGGPKQAIENVVSIFNAHPIKATLRDSELIPGFQPKPRPDLIQELNFRKN